MPPATRTVPENGGSRRRFARCRADSASPARCCSEQRKDQHIGYRPMDNSRSEHHRIEKPEAQAQEQRGSFRHRTEREETRDPNEDSTQAEVPVHRDATKTTRATSAPEETM